MRHRRHRTSDTVASLPIPAPNPLPTAAAPSWLVGVDAAVPVLPTVALKVIELASNENVSTTQLANMVSKDQVLAARILGMANSAYSASLSTIRSVPDAVVRLGITAVRNLVVTVCFTSRMQDPKVYGRHGSQLVDHAIGTAYLAHLLADHAEMDADDAFLSGLFHDIGKLVILKVAHDHKRRSGTAVAPDELDAVIRSHHAALGGVALRRLGLPTELEEPVVYHHDFECAPTRRQETALIACANRLSHRYGFGCDVEELDLLSEPCAQAIGMDEAWLEETDARAPGLFKVARQCLAA